MHQIDLFIALMMTTLLNASGVAEANEDTGPDIFNPDKLYLNKDQISDILNKYDYEANHFIKIMKKPNKKLRWNLADSGLTTDPAIRSIPLNRNFAENRANRMIMMSTDRNNVNNLLNKPDRNFLINMINKNVNMINSLLKNTKNNTEELEDKQARLNKGGEKKITLMQLENENKEAMSKQLRENQCKTKPFIIIHANKRLSADSNHNFVKRSPIFQPPSVYEIESSADKDCDETELPKRSVQRGVVMSKDYSTCNSYSSMRRIDHHPHTRRKYRDLLRNSESAYFSMCPISPPLRRNHLKNKDEYLTSGYYKRNEMKSHRKKIDSNRIYRRIKQKSYEKFNATSASVDNAIQIRARHHRYAINKNKSKLSSTTTDSYYFVNNKDATENIVGDLTPVYEIPSMRKCETTKARACLFRTTTHKIPPPTLGCHYIHLKEVKDKTK